MKQELQDLLSECTDELNDIESRINDLPALDKARCYLNQLCTYSCLWNGRVCIPLNCC